MGLAQALSAMIRFIYAVLFIWALPAQAAPRIMVTSFEPFAGDVTNTTMGTAEIIQKKLAKKNIDVQVCNLPVVYGQGAEAARKCYERMNPKPEIVISLGESGCEIKLEALAHNMDNDKKPDNAGQFHIQQKISENGPFLMALSSLTTDLYCASEDRQKLQISASPGGFVCNNTAYLLGGYFAQLQVPFTFIHIPTTGCIIDGSSKTEKKVGEKLANMLLNLPLFNVSLTSFNQVSWFMPRSGDEIKSYKNLLNNFPNTERRACGLEFMNRLAETLD